MITNFNNITEDLTEIEISFKPDIQKYLEELLFNKKTKPVKQKDIVDNINYRLYMEHGQHGLIMSTVRLRKYFNHFRSQGIIPLVATSEGCYITSDKTEIEKQILSMKERARQIMRAADGLGKFLI